MIDPAESPYLSVIRVWAAMAWADGVIAPAERDALERLIGVAELGDDERETAQSWLSTPVELDLERLASVGDDARGGIYRAALRLARVDLEIAPEERRFLERLREGLGIDDIAAREIHAELHES